MGITGPLLKTRNFILDTKWVLNALLICMELERVKSLWARVSFLKKSSNNSLQLII